MDFKKLGLILIHVDLEKLGLILIRVDLETLGLILNRVDLKILGLILIRVDLKKIEIILTLLDVISLINLILVDFSRTVICLSKTQLYPKKVSWKISKKNSLTEKIIHKICHFSLFYKINFDSPGIEHKSDKIR